MLGVAAGHIIPLNRPPIVVEKLAHEQYSTVKNAIAQEAGDKEPEARQVVASVNSDKYHYPECSGAKRIKDENKIYFSSPQQAEDSGYTLAGNCTP